MNNKLKNLRRYHAKQHWRKANENVASRRWFERGWFKAIEAIGIILAIGAIGFEVHQRFTVDRPVAAATLEEIKSAQIARAQEGVGNSVLSLASRVAALNLLLKHGQNIDGIELSCSSLGGTVGYYGCSAPSTLAGLSFMVENSRPDNIQYFSRLNFSGLWLEKFRAKDVEFRLCNFEDAKMSNGQLENVTFRGSNLRDYFYISTHPSEIAFHSTDVSNAEFSLENELATSNYKNFLSGSYFWEGFPPTLRVNRSRDYLYELKIEPRSDVDLYVKYRLYSAAETLFEEKAARAMGARMCGTSNKSHVEAIDCNIVGGKNREPYKQK